MTTINSHLAVMRSAFSTATAAAKIPDGRTSSSVGARESVCGVRVCTESTEVFALLPNIGGGLAIYSIDDLDTTTLNSVQAYDSQCAIGADFVPTGGANAPDKFRLVSAGMRLSCINSAQYNNGWFQAVRVPCDYATADFERHTSGVVVPRPAFENEVMESNRWCNHPSFVTGKLADLSKHQFNLHSNSDREFKKMGTAVSTAQYDEAWDIILVKVFVQAVGADNTPSPVIHFHCVTHMELMYDGGAAACRYHSICQQAPALCAKVIGAINKDPKASTVRSASAMAYNP